MYHPRTKLVACVADFHNTTSANSPKIANAAFFDAKKRYHGLFLCMARSASTSYCRKYGRKGETSASFCFTTNPVYCGVGGKTKWALLTSGIPSLGRNDLCQQLRSRDNSRRCRLGHSFANTHRSSSHKRKAIGCSARVATHCIHQCCVNSSIGM